MLCLDDGRQVGGPRGPRVLRPLQQPREDEVRQPRPVAQDGLVPPPYSYIVV